MTAKPEDELRGLLEQLYVTYQQALGNYLYRLVGHSGQAEELTQDVFVRACRALDRLPEEANQRAWLYRIATNLAYDCLRRRRLLQWLPLQDRDQAGSSEATGLRGPEGLVANQQAVHKALQQIPATYRVPLVLYTMEGYSVREISELLDLSESAVKTRLFRAREKFRQAYTEEE